MTTHPVAIRPSVAIRAAARAEYPAPVDPRLDERLCYRACGRAPDAKAWLAAHLRRHPGASLSAAAAAPGADFVWGRGGERGIVWCP